MKVFSATLCLFLGNLIAPWLLQAEPLPSIPVVGNYGELLKTKPVFDEDANTWKNHQDGAKDSYWGKARIKVYVGISGATFPLNGCAVLYCLIDTPDEVPVGPLFEQNALGPFEVKIAEPPQLENISHICGVSLELQKNNGYQLYMKPVPLTQAGTWKILLWGSPELNRAKNKHRPMFEAKLEVTPKKEASWYPFDPPLRGDYQTKNLQREGGEQEYFISGISNPAAGPAFPWVDGWIAFAVGKEIDPKAILPTAFPQKPSADIEVRAETNRVIAKISECWDGLGNGKNILLTRWWLNGEPLTLPEARPAAMAMEQMAQAELKNPQDSILNLDLQFEPKRFGAKEGDQIGLQLLFCPGGWAYVGDSFPGSFHSAGQADRFGFPILAQLSPRIDFIWKEGRLIPKAEK